METTALEPGLPLPLPLAAADAGVQTEAAEAAARAQAVRCGPLRLAFPHGWASAAIDMPALSWVPNAPRWLCGVANVNGALVPVIDLAAWAQPGARTEADDQPARLLIGGRADQAVGIAFTGLPRQVRTRAIEGECTAAAPLQRFVTGAAIDGDDTLAVDAPALVHALVAELSA